MRTLDKINLSQTFKYLFLYLLLFQFGSFVYLFLTGIMGIEPNYVQIAITKILFSIIPTVYLLKKFKIDWKKDLKIRKITIEQYIYLIIIAFLFQPISWGLGVLVAELSNVVPIRAYKFSYDSFFYFMIFSNIITPIIEEIWFRGLLFQKTKHIGINRAILINGVIFALAHLDLVKSSYTLLLGILCCYVFYISKSLMAPIFLHFVNNTLQIIPENNYTETYYQFIRNPIYVIPFMFLLILFMYYISKKDNKIFAKMA